MFFRVLEAMLDAKLTILGMVLETTPHISLPWASGLCQSRCDGGKPTAHRVDDG